MSKIKNPILQIDDCSIGYPYRTVASDINATIYAGQFVSLIGQNGVGKSTLIKSICGLLPLLEGAILWDGVGLELMDERELSTYISVVLTDRLEVPHATVFELVGYGRSPYTNIFGRLTKSDICKVDEALEQCGIAHKRHCQIETLSDGERQKVAIAKALAQDTPLIILDEPTAFLDLPARVEIIHLLRQIVKNSNKSIFMSTHDLDLALQMSDALWLLQPNGEISIGSPEDLMLANEFQQLFEGKNVNFDNKTGAFLVKHNHTHLVSSKGDGFGQVLMQRAFARKGVKLVDEIVNIPWSVAVNSDATSFELLLEDQSLVKTTSVEVIVDMTMMALMDI